MQSGNFIEPSESDASKDFFTDSPKGVIKSQQTAGGTDRGVEAPEQEIQTHREIAYTDPHVHEAIYTLVDWLVGDGFSIRPRSFEAALEQGAGEVAAEVTGGGDLQNLSPEVQKSVAGKLNVLLQPSSFWSVFNDWVYYAIVDGHAFMELVVEDGKFEPRLLPTENMMRKTDEFGRVTEYQLDPPSGASTGSGSEDYISYKPHEVAELFFRKEPKEDFGRSFIEPISEVADILRDMELDYARFVATKAYPPILWKLGTEEERWTPDQIDGWLETLQSIEPDSMLAAGHDVESEVVGTTSTSSTAGAMRLEETFQHFQDRIVTGLGVPALIMNMEAGGQGEAVATMPAYKRRVRRLQNIIKTKVEQQILKSLVFNSLEDAPNTVPEFEFGEYSSAEERLDADTAINLLNNGLLKPEAAARRAGIDPDSELPDVWDSNDLMTVLNALASTGDSIQNPEGGSPTDTGGGADSSGGEVTSRQDPGSDSSNGRNKKSVTEDESG